MDCRNCGAPMELFERRRYYFCTYCGTFHFIETPPVDGVHVLERPAGALPCPLCTAPLAKSVARCPADSAPSARVSSPRATGRGYPRRVGLRRVVARDERERERVLKLADLPPVSFQRLPPRSLVPEQLPFEDEPLDACVESLDAG